MTAGITIRTGKLTSIVRIESVSAPEPAIDKLQLVDYAFEVFVNVTDTHWIIVV